jgi:hypothetical protein
LGGEPTFTERFRVQLAIRLEVRERDAREDDLPGQLHRHVNERDDLNIPNGDLWRPHGLGSFGNGAACDK